MRTGRAGCGTCRARETDCRPDSECGDQREAGELASKSHSDCSLFGRQPFRRTEPRIQRTDVRFRHGRGTPSVRARTKAQARAASEI